MDDKGKYPFFTCAEEVYKINMFAFDTEALLISGNGANLGYIHYYNGKFNAYQRTYILDKFKENIQYVRSFLEAFLHKRIMLEKSTSNTPYIVLSTLRDMTIILPETETQEYVSNFMNLLKRNLDIQMKSLAYYEMQKKYLLRQMFI